MISSSALVLYREVNTRVDRTAGRERWPTVVRRTSRGDRVIVAMGRVDVIDCRASIPSLHELLHE